MEYRNQAFIGGRYVSAASGETFPCVSPIDGRVLTSIASCGAEDVDRAVRSARVAFERGDWARRPPAERKRILQDFARRIEAQADELAMLETLDMGKPIRYARSVDLSDVVETVDWFAEAVDKIYGEVAPTGEDVLALVTREPIGVVAAVVPWNFPLLLAAWKFAPALAAGNSVILKPAEQSPLTALRVAEIAAEAGIPDGVFNVVPGLGETAGRAIGLHMDIDAVAFTGSTDVGKLFLRYAGESNMKSVSLECGGKSPNIVFADAPDLEVAAKAAVEGVFFNSGQVCIATSRLLIEECIYDAFLARVVALAEDFRPGDPLAPETRMGPLVDSTHMERVLAYVDQGQREGASLVLGGQRVREACGGYYVEPTVFGRVDNRMVIAREEIFGPVLATMTFSSVDEAVAIANDTIYGLQATIWTRDITRAHRVARTLRAGTVTVNTTDGGAVSVPFGGYKQSGFGRDNSLHAFDKYTQLKTTYIGLI